MNPKVSMIIPVYNVGRYLAECLESIIHQSYQNIEVIIVDDGSTDQTAEIAKAYVKQQESWSYYYQENQGQGVARNHGLTYATGTYIHFMDGDDYLAENLIEKAVTAMEEERLDLWGFSAYTFTDNVEEKNWSEQGYKYRGVYDRCYTGLEMVSALIENHDTDITCCWNFLIRKAFVDHHHLRFPEGIIYEDNLFHLKAYILAERVRICNQPLYYHRYHSGSTIARSNYPKTYDAMSKLLIETYDFAKVHKELPNELINWYLHDYAWKAANAWIWLSHQERQSEYRRALCKDLKQCVFEHYGWGDDKLKLFAQNTLLFWGRQRIRKLFRR